MLVKKWSRVILLHFCTTESCIAKSFPVTISVCYWDWCHVCTDSLESPTTPRLQQNYQRNRGCGWSETHHFLWMCFVRWSLWHYFDIICVERRGRVGRMSVLWSLIWCNNKYLDTGTIWSTSDTHWHHLIHIWYSPATIQRQYCPVPLFTILETILWYWWCELESKSSNMKHRI